MIDNQHQLPTLNEQLLHEFLHSDLIEFNINNNPQWTQDAVKFAKLLTECQEPEPVEKKIYLHEKQLKVTTCASANEVVQRIMTAHWDVGACKCWVCRTGRDLGLCSEGKYLLHMNNNRERFPGDIGWAKQ